MTDKSQTLLAFDHGEVRVGIARVDTLVGLPQPLATVSPNDLEAIKKLIDINKPTELIVGLPRGLGGQETDQTRSARQFASSLGAFGLPVVLQDEALTSNQARTQKGQAKTSIDEIAACIILEDYLREHVNKDHIK
jgi:putative holliday junction resolvase